MYNFSESSDKKNTPEIGIFYFAGKEAVKTADEIEFYKWLDRNYHKSGIFSSQKAMQNYINGGTGQEKAFTNIIQGKGYENDWINSQRKKLLNIGKVYDAGNIANRPGSDVTERSLLTGKCKEYQMKAYTSNNTPDLHNTPKDMTVVVNAEKVNAVSNKGYIDVEVFKTSDEISKKTQLRMNKIKYGKIHTAHTLSSVLSSAVTSGSAGGLFGSVVEAINSGRAYINGDLSAEEYAGEILKSGAQAGTTAMITTAVTTPLAAGLAAAGMASTPIVTAAAFGVSTIVGNVLAPAFKRGIYKEMKDTVDHMQATAMLPVNEMVNTALCSVQMTSDFANQYIQHQNAYTSICQESEKNYKDTLELLNFLPVSHLQNS